MALIIQSMIRYLGLFAVIFSVMIGGAGCDNHLGAPPPKIQGTSVDARPGGQRPPPSNAAPRPDERIIVTFGDSLTAGLGVPAGETYPSQLQEKLLLAGYHYRVVNAGVSGDTTAGALRRVDWIMKSKPAIVILELGINDGLRGLDLKETESNLEQIIRRLRANDTQVILAGMKLPPNYGSEYTKTFQSLYSEVAKRNALPFIPFFLDKVATVHDLNQADGVHPTAAGYTLVVDNVWPVLEPLLKR
jgi:acyl-CoA thioesterase-1